jgi:hypothetical protein
MLDAMSKAAAAAPKAKTFLFMIASKLRFNPGALICTDNNSAPSKFLITLVRRRWLLVMLRGRRD